jgi:nitroreductase
MNLVDHAKSANHCQRIWSDRKIDQVIIEELVGVAVNMPTKQNEEYYGLLVTTDQEFNEFVYMNSHTYEDAVLNLPFEQRHLTNTNTQMRAPLVFLWLAKHKKFEHGDLNKEGLISIGVSSGAVALAANQLGLKTGFCCCLYKPPLLEKINQEWSINYQDIIIALGIGYPEEHYPHNTVRRPDGSITYKNTYEKNIPIFRK